MRLEGVDLSGDRLVLLNLLNENCCGILRAEFHFAFGPFSRAKARRDLQEAVIEAPTGCRTKAAFAQAAFPL